jgi:probable F420-dependent oxidoreductase
MRIGIQAFATDNSVDPVTIGRAVEDWGFDSLWFGEHSHMPVGSVHPATGTGQAPSIYRRFLDPFVALAAVAATTNRLRIGTSVALPAEHHPIHFAKHVASLDLLSGGRLDLGVGYGWNGKEMANLGVDVSRRRATAVEKLRAAKELWTQEVATFEGEFSSISPSWAWPKPVQLPHPPIYVGGPPSAWLFDDIVAVADGWFPVLPIDPARLAAAVHLLNVKHEVSGRAGPGPDVIALELVAGIRGTSPEAFAAALPRPADVDALAAAGVSRLIVSVPAPDLERLAAALDAVAQLRAAARACGDAPTEGAVRRRAAAVTPSKVAGVQTTG